MSFYATIMGTQNTWYNQYFICMGDILVVDCLFDCLGHSLLEYLGETIPKLKTRSQGVVSQQQTAASSGSTSGGKKNKGKKK